MEAEEYFKRGIQRYENGEWRRGRDSNPRDGCPPTRFPGVRLRPLGHLSCIGEDTTLSAFDVKTIPA